MITARGGYVGDHAIAVKNLGFKFTDDRRLARIAWIASCRRGSPKSEYQIVDAYAPRAGQSKSQRTDRIGFILLRLYSRCCAMHEQSFNPQPTARKSLFYTHGVLSIATILNYWDLILINIKSIVVEEESVTVATIRFDYDYEHRPPRRTEHEHDEIRC